MDQEKKKPTDPQIIVVLRAAVGAYLLYLAWGLREAAFSGESPVSLLFMIVFVLAGVALLFFSVRQLYRRDFLYPWQSQKKSDGKDEKGDGEEEKGDGP